MWDKFVLHHCIKIGVVHLVLRLEADLLWDSIFLWVFQPNVRFQKFQISGKEVWHVFWYEKKVGLLTLGENSGPVPGQKVSFFEHCRVIVWTTGNTLLQSYVTLWHAENRPNKCNSYAKGHNLELGMWSCLWVKISWFEAGCSGNQSYSWYPVISTIIKM